VTERDPVERDQDGWYLRCGDERRGPFKWRPQRTGDYQTSTATSSGGESAFQKSSQIEIWKADGERIQIVRSSTTLSGGEPAFSERFLDTNRAE
jgi:hypothetical protein